MVLWRGEPWNDVSSKADGQAAYDPLDEYRLRQPWGPDDPLPPAAWQAIERAGVEVVRPRGRVMLDRALAFLGMVLLAAVVAGGFFFWAGVLGAWMRTH